MTMTMMRVDFAGRLTDSAGMTTDDVRSAWNRCRHDPARTAGHYESYFQRANHPTRPLAFWIRYTVFSPEGRPRDAVGELWAVWFDGERGQITAVKSAVPIAHCRFDRTCLSAQVGEARLNEARLSGAAASTGHAIAWDLEYAGDDPPLLLLPEGLYEGAFPAAKALVGTPNATYRGTISVDGEVHAIDGWVGSQNHNWGRRHTDRYAWAQVAGFDELPDSFLECSTAQIKLGPVWSPRFTLVVLRVEGEEYALNSLTRAVRASGRWSYFQWSLRSRQNGVDISAQISAPRERFVGLRYADPPDPHGPGKVCLNSKLASVQLTLRRAGRPDLRLTSAHRAAFEIVTDDRSHGVPVVA
jgi:hypothetical protein